MMKKISPAMKGMLKFMLMWEESPQVQTARPGHYENLQTHNALLRRGMIREDAPSEHGVVISHLTDKGRAEAKKP